MIMSREYREESRTAGDRAEDLVEQFMLNQGIDIRKNAPDEVDFTVWNNGSPLYHIEVEHKVATSEPHAISGGMNWLSHKVDKYIHYSLKVYYVMVITHWKHFYVMTMDDIREHGYRREPITDRKGMGSVYTTDIKHTTKRSLV
jgi:hypothetical protein